MSKFVPADDLIVPYSANSLEDAEAVIHVIKISENELRKQQVSCLLYTSPSPRDGLLSRMPSSA